MAKSTTLSPAQQAVNLSRFRATRRECAEVKAILIKQALDAKQPVDADRLRPTSKANDAKGKLRFNIIEACRASATVGDAKKRTVFGAPGSKHDEEPYRLKMVDVCFCITNGFVEVIK